MGKSRIESLVEDYLNYRIDQLPIAFDEGKDSIEQFKLHTIKRLKVAFNLFSDHGCGLNNFLIALRDYLLTFQTDICLDKIKIPEDNLFAISRDPQSERYFAAFCFPDYINHAFVEYSYLNAECSEKHSIKDYALHTDPAIRKITGFSFFKSMDQKLAVYGALNTPDGFTTLVSLPTGGGKSLITQTLSYQKDGLTVVIVPTVSLAIDQVRVAKQIIKSSNIDSEIFSYSSGVDAAPILRAIKQKAARMLFISPESLINNQGFSDVIKEANATRYLKNIVIDEAHIVVDWGASFRIDYQCLESWRKKMLLSNPSIRTILLSATYERHCVSILKDFFAHDGKWIEIRCDSLRHEPHYMLVKAKSYTDKNRKMLELVRKMPHPMIIYVARPDDASDIKNLLNENGISNVKTFTGLTTGPKRKELIDAWVDDQFEIMIATSAFGVGVDKSDVRTVLHMYIPQNPNAYYQELGRGGRDKLPCLSIMCIHPDDINISFQRISKKVMTTEKIIGRWNSMYNSKSSQRVGNLNYIDTTIKPNYSVADTFDDTPTSDADMNWNIYVILLLRRYGLICIREVLPQSGKYIFVIEIIEDALRVNDNRLFQEIDQIRVTEWAYYVDAFHSMQHAIKNSGKVCWSEMFYETYDKVSEYCAGCNAHSNVNEGDFLEFPLKVPVKMPMKELAQDQLALFGGASDIIFIATESQEAQLVNFLMEKRLAVLVISTDKNIEHYLDSITCLKNLLILNGCSLRELIKRKSHYYISGVVAVSYSGTPKEIYDQLIYITNNLSKQPGIKVVHILRENTFFEWINKAFSDLVDGSVIPIKSVCPYA
ncbi:DEAD/DEAH box helicase [Papillibacter cinnamivorans]|uniref:DNA 3'-5' helicase n=1 Tax=Papillibacter cinnamivorans DSM 12816 TaxID=1122930 RepID=A0A1W2APC9_9FIRM|nr:DEAD/DEAH box helicase [Papillibacter cinnamivorans]SMC62068.1 ATP-dependent DNA helicase RecQ [Papillibacter cinnamivorans DSM 12816]